MPPLPEKQSVGRFGSEFVEARRRALEKFLSRVLYHPELGKSDYFKQFLNSDDTSLHRLKETSQRHLTKSSSASPTKWLAMGTSGKAVRSITTLILNIYGILIGCREDSCRHQDPRDYSVFKWIRETDECGS